MRELKAKAQACFLNTARNQSLALGGVPARGVTNFKLAMSPETDVMLGVLDLTASGPGQIEDILVQGKTLNVTDKPAPIDMFLNTSTNTSERYLGVTLKGGLSLSINGALDGAGNVAGSWFIDPVDKAVPYQEQAGFYNYFAGVGTLAIGAGGEAIMRAVTDRPATLGKLTIVNRSAAVVDTDLFVTSVKINGVETLSGEQDNQEIPLSSFFSNSQAGSGLDLNAKISANQSIAIKIKNRDAGNAASVMAGILCHAY